MLTQPDSPYLDVRGDGEGGDKREGEGKIRGEGKGEGRVGISKSIVDSSRGKW